MDYLDVASVKDRPGLRLVLSAGVPGPWGEAAKGVLGVKEIDYQPVAQQVGAPNPELQAWTGRRNAPIAIYNDEAPRDGWAAILFLAERLAPRPALIPRDPAERALMFGLAHELCGEHGFGWSRRLMLIHSALEAGPGAAGRDWFESFGRWYGYSAAAGAAAPERCADILRMLGKQLTAQRSRGSQYLVGDTLSAADIYWATFAALVDPLPPELCPMTDQFRALYLCTDASVMGALDPVLLEHRDFIYKAYLGLPLDF